MNVATVTRESERPLVELLDRDEWIACLPLDAEDGRDAHAQLRELFRRVNRQRQGWRYCYLPVWIDRLPTHALPAWSDWAHQLYLELENLGFTAGLPTQAWVDAFIDRRQEQLWPHWRELLPRVAQAAAGKPPVRVVAFVSMSLSRLRRSERDALRAFIELVGASFPITVVLDAESISDWDAIVQGRSAGERSRRKLISALQAQSVAEHEATQLADIAAEEFDAKTVLVMAQRIAAAEFPPAAPLEFAPGVTEAQRELQTAAYRKRECARQVRACKRLLLLLMLEQRDERLYAKIMTAKRGSAELYDLQTSDADTKFSSATLQLVRKLLPPPGADATKVGLVDRFAQLDEAAAFVAMARSLLGTGQAVPEPIKYLLSEQLASHFLKVEPATDPSGGSNVGVHLIAAPQDVFDRLEHEAVSSVPDETLGYAYLLLGDWSLNVDLSLAEKAWQRALAHSDDSAVRLAARIMLPASMMVMPVDRSEIEQSNAHDSEKQLLRWRFDAARGNTVAATMTARETYTDTGRLPNYIAHTLHRWLLFDYTVSQTAPPKLLQGGELLGRLVLIQRVFALARLCLAARVYQLGPFAPGKAVRAVVSYRNKPAEHGAREAATQLADALNRAKYKAFYDQRVRSTQDWSERILSEFLCARVFLALLTPGYHESPWCDVERDLMLALREFRSDLAYVVPVQFERTDCTDRLKELTPVRVQRDGGRVPEADVRRVRALLDEYRGNGSAEPDAESLSDPPPEPPSPSAPPDLARSRAGADARQGRAPSAGSTDPKRFSRRSTMSQACTWLQRLAALDLLDLLYPQDSIGDLRHLAWKPNDADRRGAWNFLIELRSRIATQPLAFRSGDEESALTSVYQLFGVFRKNAEENPGSYHFSVLTMQMLDRLVRGFTSHWHKEAVAGRLRSADVCVTFRADLLGVQANLRRVMPLICDLAGVPAIPALAPGARQAPWTNGSIELSPAAQDSALSAVFASERAEIARRRALVQGTASPNDGAPLFDGVGVALSGGGIRSATFAMGVIEVLAQKGMLREVDYLSTVSGGGYFGGVISCLLGDGDHPAKPAEAFERQNGRENVAIQAVRNHSKYLIEGGFKSAFAFAGLIVFGILSTLLLVAPLPLAVAALFVWAQAHPLVLGWTVGAGLLGAASGYAIAQLGQSLRKNRMEWFGLGALLGGLGLALIAWLLRQSWSPGALWSSGTQIGLGIAAIVTATAAVALPRVVGRRLLGFVIVVLAPALLILAAGAVAALAQALPDPLAIGGWTFGGRWQLLLFAAGVLLLLSLFIQLNYASPHRYYRDRLASTYLRHRIVADAQNPSSYDVVSIEPPPRLSQLNASGFAPYHLINAALNVPGSTRKELRGRRADFFLFSKYWCGAPLTGYLPTTAWEQSDRRLDLASAIAISGAAAAPNMGTNAASQFRTWLALFNVRLSYWLRKPGSGAWLIAWRYFFHELLGNMTEDMAYLNVSDGGHIENLGIYELLRRQCKFVIAIDGEADPQRTCGSLLALTQFASIDLGVGIKPDLSNLHSDGQGIGRAHFELFRIEYPTGAVGLLLYIKSSLTGNESEFLKRYHAEHPDFPHESTAQQLYSERQFEAYRALGEHIAAGLFDPNLVGSWSEGQPLSVWFEQLSKNLL